MADTSSRVGTGVGNKSVEFSTAESGELSEAGSRRKERPAVKRTLLSRNSFFTQLSQSFRRSGGERGADVEALRGTHGADFEAEGMINRAESSSGCGCSGQRSQTKERLLLVKGPFIFVYTIESDKTPKYAISLAHVKARSKGLSGGFHMVDLETCLGDTEYTICFKTEDIAKEFVSVAGKQAAVGEAEEVRKRLGHENLLVKRKSTRYAEKIALKKVDKQPEKNERLAAGELDRLIGTSSGLPI